MIKNNSIGLTPSRFDLRDYRYFNSEVPLAEQVDLREWDSLVEYQGQIGSCSAHAVTSAFELMIKNMYPTEFFELSRLFLYYNSRVIEGTVTLDQGVLQLRNVLAAGKEYGLCKEDLWPYLEGNLIIQPSLEAYQDAKLRTISRYWRLESINQMLDSISNIRPVVIGLEVYSGFADVGANGVVSMPGDNETLEGGHAMVLVGYDQPQKTFTAKNSFGTSWGDNGYCYLPWEYIGLYVFERWCFDINIQ